MSKKSSILLFAISAFNLIYNSSLPLHPDEAYYWAWSKHLQLSYFDHPPMIAYLIKLATFVSSSESAIRLVAVVCMTIAAWVVYQLAKRLFDEQVADIALLILLFMPATQAGYLIVTPDAPLILFWSLTLYCAYRAVWEGENRWYYLAGICGGCTLLSKYTGILLFAGLGLFLLASKYRTVLRRKEIYFTMLMALVIFTPVILWNAQHDWVSFRFQLMHGMGGAKVFKLKYLADFVGGQALTMNPVFLFALLYYAIRHFRANLRDEKTAFLFWPFLITFAFFLYGGLFKKSEANWAVPAYISGAILLAYWIRKCNHRWVYYAGINLTILMVALVKYPEVFPHLPKKLVMKQQFMGYKEIFRQAGRYTENPDTVILSDSYQHASEAWYYLPGRPEVHILTPTRISMYDFWLGDLAKRPLKDAVFFGSDENAMALHRFYAHVDLIDSLRYKNRYVEREIRVYRCANLPALFMNSMNNAQKAADYADMHNPR